MLWQPGHVQTFLMQAIDNRPITGDRKIDFEGEYVDMAEIVERKLKGDHVTFTVWRNRQTFDAKISLSKVWPYSIQAHRYNIRPRYVLYGGLLFQPLSRDLLEAYQPNNLRVRHLFDFYVVEGIYLQHPDVIVLTTILADPVNSYFTPYLWGIVDEVNGIRIKILDDLAKCFAEAKGELSIKMIGGGPPLVLNPEQIAPARERIKTRYDVHKEENLNSNTKGT